MVLLLLSGDVHCNPGPEIYPCGFCCEPVTDIEAVCCDCCDKWIHVSCDQGLSSAEYKSMVNNPCDGVWFCYNCATKLSQSAKPRANTGLLSCVCLNARSVMSKRFDFLAYICARGFDFIAVTETFLDDSVHDSHVAPPGYSVFRCDRNRHGGGVMILVRDCFNSFRRHDLEANCELLWIELPTKASTILLGVVYRPPLSSVSYLEELHTSLLCAVKYNVPVILCGDFNLPNIDWTTVSPSPCTPDASMFCEIISDCFLSQLVSFNTRKDHILDLVLTTHPDHVSFISPCDSLPDTDHNAISFSVSAVLSSSSNNTWFLYNYSDIDLTHFNSVFFRIPWNVIDHDGDIELSWSMWKDLFLCAIDSTIPKVKWKSRKLKHWFSPSTINLIHKKASYIKLCVSILQLLTN